MATGGGHLPPNKPPSISFELSDVVKKYAVSLQVKLAGLAPIDSDNVSCPADDTPSTPTTSQTLNVFDNEGAEAAAIDSSHDGMGSFDSEAMTTMATTTTASTPKPTSTSTSTTSALSFPFSSSQMFATQSQRRRRRNTEGIDSWNTNSNSSNSRANSANSSAQNYLENKSQLLADENQGRNEWHKKCMDVKNEELAMKKKQSEIWSIILNDLKSKKVFHFVSYSFVSFVISFSFVSTDKYLGNGEHS